ncbi:MAG: hypothetical protein K6F78_10230 [Bacteroidaceae bacterium]|nr:hypothetical protein [Bacteroidaceae bacterium]
MAEIFNQEALQALDDHSEVEEMARVVSPSLRVILAAMLTICAVALFWCIFGTINYKIKGTGIIFPFGEPYSMTLPFEGNIDKVFTTHGATVQVGTPLVQVRNNLATSSITAPRAGVMLNYLAEGTAFHAREPLVWMMPQETELHERELLCYLDFKSMRKLKIGQEVQVTPSDLQRETWGYAYGHITGIEPFPTNQTEIMRRLKLEQFASFVPKDQAVYEVRVVLDIDDKGIVWSREKSRQLKMKTGSLCTIQVITSEKKVWQVLMSTVSDTFDNVLDK